MPPGSAPTTSRIRREGHTQASVATTVPPSTTTTTVPPVVQLGAIPPPHPGRPTTVFGAQSTTNQLALTIDDGYCAECVAAYVAFVQQTGIHITFSPNGAYRGYWEPFADTLKPLIEAGQVQIANHTYDHYDLTRSSNAQVHSELDRNELWIEQTFGVTSRPWYRPPFGYHNARTDEIAGQLGYTKVLMWNGTFGDATLLTPDELMAQATQYLKPGTVMLGHANHPTVTHLFDRIRSIIDERGLEPVTLDEMFGTSRAEG
ncbi:MAG: polysaccharide deacetylase family protein [Acidimicrobiales bacterium]|nr:polysaccharide deacetylase family protein [Acidimicrobiales bacterium]